MHFREGDNYWTLYILMLNKTYLVQSFVSLFNIVSETLNKIESLKRPNLET